MRALPIAVLLIGFAACATAADHPIAGDLLRLKDPANDAGRRFFFRAARDAGIGTDVGDPRTSGATLEVAGVAAGDGATGTIDLPATGWTGLGRPAGSKGFRYVDRSGPIRHVLVKTGTRGTIVASGRGSAWPFAMDGPQGPIDVRLVIGDQRFCAAFTSYERNAGGRVVARNAVAPRDCTPTTSICGNGVAEPGEDCDDGNTTNGDGCSSACVIESAAGLCAGIPTASGAALRAVPVAEGLDQPVFVTAARLDPSRLFVVEQPGRIRLLVNGVLQPQPFLDIADRVACCNEPERGLLSVAFHPQYATNGRLFVYYTNNQGNLVIARYDASESRDSADPSSEKILLTITHQPNANHNGGQLAFGPDGYLYAGTGDGGGGGDPQENGQDVTQLLGKMLRLDVDVDTPPYYAPPATNPFVGAIPGRDEIWAYGVRNPWRFGFDRGTGELYIADVGQDHWEEVDVQPAADPGGENYGWDVFEGTHCFEPDPAPSCPVPPTGFTMPVLEYSHDDGCSITGGYVYRGCRMPDLRGTYFYADYCTPFIKTFSGVSGGVAQNQADRTAELVPSDAPLVHIATFGEDARGEIYLADHDGRIYRIEPAS